MWSARFPQALKSLKHDMNNLEWAKLPGERRPNVYRRNSVLVSGSAIFTCFSPHDFTRPYAARCSIATTEIFGRGAKCQEAASPERRAARDWSKGLSQLHLQLADPSSPSTTSMLHRAVMACPSLLSHWTLLARQRSPAVSNMLKRRCDAG